MTNRPVRLSYYPSIQSSGRMSLYELAEEASSRSTLTPADMMVAVESILAIIQPLDQAKTRDNVGLGWRNIQLRR